MAETITLRKSTFMIIIAVFVAIASFSIGYVAGGNSPTGFAIANTENAVIRLSDPFGDDPVLGNRNAPLVLIEFSDFQCPFCRSFYTQTLNQLKTTYVDTGKVAFVYKDLPLPYHEGAIPYALASECADEQGKWEEMHDKIFDEQNIEGTGTIAYPGVDALKQWASEIGLNTQQFNSCFDSEKYRDEIQEDLRLANEVGVGATPTFLIGNAQNGFTKVEGALPFAVFKQVIDEQLA